jgi:CRP-like cAMP-binding protein
MDVPAGERLIQQGAPADAFYVIERGEASVTQDAEHIRDLGDGDFFGELAMLRGGPRTASVVAETDMRVRVVRGSDFAHAMRKIPTLARSVSALATDRLRNLPAHPATA